MPGSLIIAHLPGHRISDSGKTACVPRILRVQNILAVGRSFHTSREGRSRHAEPSRSSHLVGPTIHRRQKVPLGEMIASDGRGAGSVNAYCKTRLLDGAVTIGQGFAWLPDLSKQRSVRDLSRPSRALEILLVPSHAPATELASLYHDGREIEATDGVGQEALAGTASEPARKDPRPRRAANRKAGAGAQRIPLLSARCATEEDPDRPSFTHAVRVVRLQGKNPGASPRCRIART